MVRFYRAMDRHQLTVLCFAMTQRNHLDLIHLLLFHCLVRISRSYARFPPTDLHYRLGYNPFLIAVIATHYVTFLIDSILWLLSLPALNAN